MVHTNTKSGILKYTIIFGVVYALIWIFPGIIIYPTDKLIEIFKGVNYVDGWTPGLMVWLTVVIGLPLLFLLVALNLFLKIRKARKERLSES